MRPFRKARPQHGRSAAAAAAQYSGHQQGPPNAYYASPPTPIEYPSAAPPVAYTPSYGPPPPIPAYFPPTSQAPYYSFAQPDKRQVELIIRNQIEYYFSAANLIKDTYLRNKMDVEGFVSLNELANFPRVQRLTQDMDTIISALNESEVVEICDGVKIRPRHEPLRWPFPRYVSQQQQPQFAASSQHAQAVVDDTLGGSEQTSQLELQQTIHHTTQQELQFDQPHEQQVIHKQQLQPHQKQEQQQSEQQPQQQQSHGNPKQGPTPSDASSPNTSSNTSDISSGANNVDSANRSSFTYATAVSSKQPTINGHDDQHQPQLPQTQQAQQQHPQPPHQPSHQQAQQQKPPQHQSRHSQSQSPKQDSSQHNQHQKQNLNQSHQKQTQPQQHQQTHQQQQHHESQPNPLQQQQQPIGDIPNNSKHHKTSTTVESEWKEVKSRRRRSGKA